MIPRRAVARVLRLAAAAALAGAAAAPPAARAIPASFPAAELVQDRWTTRDGLPVSGVAAVLASASGYLWLGTDEGVARFDGSRFTVFDRSVEPGLPMSATSAIHEDPSGALWAGTDAGLAVRRGQHFEAVQLEGVERVSLNGIADDGAGGVWAATDRGLFHVAPRARSGQRDRRLGDVAVAAVAGDGHGGVWAGGPWGLDHLPAVGPVLLRVFAAELGGGVRCLEARRDGALRIGGAGVYQLDPGAERPALLPGSGALRVRSLLTDRDGVLWIAAFGGVLRAVGGGLEAIPLAGANTPARAIQLAEDHDGSIWVGTADSGLLRLRIGVAATVGVGRGLPSEVVNAVRETRDGTLWLATSGGLAALRAGTLALEPLPLAPGERVFSLDEDARGRVLAGTDARLFRREGGRWRELRPAPAVEPGRIRAVVVDGEGVTWAGTGRGLYRFDGSRFVPALDAAGDEVGSVVAAFARTPSGAIWACGLSGVGPLAGGRFQRIPGTTGCFGLTAGADGTIWAGQMGGGFLRIRGTRVDRFTRSEGILEENVLNAIEDGRGSVWLSGNHGIQRVALADLDAVAEGRARAVTPLQYGTSDGMADRECNATGSPSAWRGADGRLWFPTARGAVVFDPAREEPRPPPPRVAIEEVLVDGARVDPAPELRLPPGTRRVAIRYTGLALAAPDRLRFRHRLAGLDDREVDAGPERSVQYAGLPPGRYRFAVRAVRERGVASDRPAELTFVLEPHLWQTSGFLAALGLAALGAAFGVERLRARSARRRERELRQRLDACVSERPEAKRTHGTCPTCAGKLERGEPG